MDATGTQYAYLTPVSFLQDPTRIRLQHHGTDTHTNFIGMIANIAASAVIARLLPPLNGAEAGQVPQVNSAVDGYILGALAAGGISADQLARLVPDFSSEPDGDFLRLVSGAMAWDAAADLVTQIQLRDYRQHTPESGGHLTCLHTSPADFCSAGNITLVRQTLSILSYRERDCYRRTNI